MVQSEQGRYEYVCSSEADPLIETHTVVVKSRKLRRKTFYGLLVALLLIIAIAGQVQWIVALLPLALGLLLPRPVKQEAVVVMPSLGVQLETVYGNGKVLRRFVPMHWILAAVINEAVTPTHCYFYLALILRDKPKLTLAFKEIKPPLDILVPVWRCLCNTIDPDPASPTKRIPSATTRH